MWNQINFQIKTKNRMTGRVTLPIGFSNIFQCVSKTTPTISSKHCKHIDENFRYFETFFLEKSSGGTCKEGSE